MMTMPTPRENTELALHENIYEEESERNMNALELFSIRY